MIIDDFNIKGIAILKAKAYTPLFVDTNTPLPCAIMNQRFQPVGRRKTQILNTRGRIQLHQTHCRSLENFRRQPA